MYAWILSFHVKIYFFLKEKKKKKSFWCIFVCKLKVSTKLLAFLIDMSHRFLPQILHDWNMKIYQHVHKFCGIKYSDFDIFCCCCCMSFLSSVFMADKRLLRISWNEKKNVYVFKFLCRVQNYKVIWHALFVNDEN